MAETATNSPADYWFGGPITTPGLHVRAHHDPEGRSVRSDMASIVANWHASGAAVAGICPRDRSKLIAAVGLGWRDGRFDASTAGDLVSATAAVGRLWETGNAKPAVVIPAFMSLATGPHGGHDDSVAAAWLDAVLHGDVDALARLTGLDLRIYLGVSDLEPPATAVAVGTGIRRSDRPVSVATIMGSQRLLEKASSVVAFDDVTFVDDTVHATMLMLKARSGLPGSTQAVTRPLEGEHAWTIVL